MAGRGDDGKQVGCRPMLLELQGLLPKAQLLVALPPLLEALDSPALRKFGEPMIVKH